MSRPCTYPGGCRTLVKGAGDRCSVHPLTATEARRRVRRPAAQTLYGSAEWKRESKRYLNVNPFCVCPKHQGKPLAKGGARATVVDHIRKHHGDLTLFWDETNWQALAKPCHDSWKRQVENDEEASQGSVYKAPRTAGNRREHGAPRVTIVSGPPGSGKSTLVKLMAHPIDVVLDLDVIASELSGQPIYRQTNAAILRRAMAERDRRLAALAPGDHAWLITGAPRAEEREQLARANGNAQVLLLLPALATCKRHVRGDERRVHCVKDFEQAIHRWYRYYTPRPADLVAQGGPLGAIPESFKGYLSRGLARDQIDPVRVSGGHFDTLEGISSAPSENLESRSVESIEAGGFVLA